MKNLRYVIALASLLFCGLSMADDKPKLPADNPCSTDIQKYCSNVTPGEGRLAQCMKKHASELSKGCKKFGKKYKKEHPEVGKELSQDQKK